TFDEAVTGFELGDIEVDNGTVGDFSGSGAVYTANITPVANGAVTVNVRSEERRVGRGNENTEAEEFSIEYDGTQPGVVISSSAGASTNISPIPITITFDEAVTGFELGDIEVDNGTVGDFSGSGAVYTANITPDANGAVTVNVAADVATDGSGNGNTASQFRIAYNDVPPADYNVVRSEARRVCYARV